MPSSTTNFLNKQKRYPHRPKPMNKQKRLNRLQQKMQEEKVDALLINDLVDIFYLSGIQLSAGQCLVTHDSAHLLVDGRYLEMCTTQSAISPILEEKNTLPSLLPPSCKQLAFVAETTTYQQWENLSSQLLIPLLPVPHWVREQRAIKDPEELTLLRNAAHLGSEGYDYILSILSEGITEIEVARELEFFWRKKGAQKLGFDPIIAFGSNTSQPHYHPQPIPLKKGDPVLIDIGVYLNGYHSDMTRTLFFGEPSPKMREIYATCLEAQTNALAACHPGTTVGEIDDIARSTIANKGFGNAFPHGLGHGVGLEIHELPILKGTTPYRNTPLKENMVITIEPGIYLPSIGGVRIEDTIAITKNGYEDLTQRPKELAFL